MLIARRRHALTAAAAIVVAGLFGACSGAVEEDARFVLRGAVSTPALDSDGSYLAQHVLVDGLVHLEMLRVDDAGPEQVWSVDATHFRPDGAGVGPPLLVEDSAIAISLDPETFSASISRRSLESGDVIWKVPLGPHVGGPFLCGSEKVCVEAHPEAAPTTVHRFRMSDGDASSSELPGRLVFADDTWLVHVSDLSLTAGEIEGGAAVWDLSLSEVFGAGFGHGGGFWAKRSGSTLVVWLGALGSLEGRAAFIDLPSSQVIDVVEAEIPCLVPPTEHLVCLQVGAEARLFATDGAMIDAKGLNERSASIRVVSRFDRDGRLLLELRDGWAAVTEAGFEMVAEPGDSGWCSVDPPDLVEDAFDPPASLTVSRRYVPCSLSSGEPLGLDPATELAMRARETSSAESLVRSAMGTTVFFAGLDQLVVVRGEEAE